MVIRGMRNSIRLMNSLRMWCAVTGAGAGGLVVVAELAESKEEIDAQSPSNLHLAQLVARSLSRYIL